MKGMLGNRKLLLVFFAIALIIYLAFVAWTIFEYNRYASTTTAKYEARGIPTYLIDLHGYGHFWYADVATWTGIGLVIAGILVAFAGNERKTAVAMCFMVLMMTIPITTVQAQTTRHSGGNMLTENITSLQEPEPIYVSTLIYLDEECDDEYRRSRYWEDFFENLGMDGDPRIDSKTIGTSNL